MVRVRSYKRKGVRVSAHTRSAPDKSSWEAIGRARRRKNSEGESLRVLRDEKIDNLRVTILHDPEDRTKRGGYKYLVTGYGGTAHTAFRTDSGWRHFLKTTGLKKGEKGWMSSKKVESYELNGSYRRISYAGSQKQLDAWARARNYKRTPVMSNGDYVRGWYMPGEIHYMNPNYDRAILNYRETDQRYG